MKATGREMQAMLVARIVYTGVPFTRTQIKKLSKRDLALADSAAERIYVARESLVSHPGPWNDVDRIEFLERCANVDIDDKTKNIYIRMLTATIAEMRHDWEPSIFAAHITVTDLKNVLAHLIDSQKPTE